MASYALREKFELGYRNKEDISNLPPEVLVVGSQNVLTNAAEQVGIRQGYVLDGPASVTEDLGSTVVVNGNFAGSAASWTLGTGWTYNDNNVIYTP